MLFEFLFNIELAYTIHMVFAMIGLVFVSVILILELYQKQETKKRAVSVFLLILGLLFLLSWTNIVIFDALGM